MKPLFSSFLFITLFFLSICGYALSADEQVYDGTVFTEDVTWRGNVLVKGFVVVPPQATLRIEAGTVVRFSSSDAKNAAARLLVQGRIQATGSSNNPIIFTSGKNQGAKGDWYGISLVSSEKRNIIEHSRIEFASTAIDTRFSSISLKAVSISKSETGILSHDSVLQLAGTTVTDSQTGIEGYDSEFDIRDSTVTNCQRGFVINRSSAGITTSRIKGNAQYGLLSEDCRIRISSGEISENGNGARIKGGEGQIQKTRFAGNSETALHLSGTRMKVQRCQFTENKRDAIRAEDGRALFSGNAFNSNSGFNIYNAGNESVSALLNWWGGTDQSAISQKIHDSLREPRSGNVQIFPWLTEKPPLMQ